MCSPAQPEAAVLELSPGSGLPGGDVLPSFCGPKKTLLKAVGSTWLHYISWGALKIIPVPRPHPRPRTLESLVMEDGNKYFDGPRMQPIFRTTDLENKGRLSPRANQSFQYFTIQTLQKQGEATLAPSPLVALFVCCLLVSDILASGE